ncbi:MAG TPA: serine racemase VanT catalytic subunit, partial [Clostridiaceae bacterium]|nr:serine racemase VanT catalytic subunit [Clostridiaceae bacterium]
ASLKPVLSVKARVALVKDIFKGEAAGYGLQFVAKQDTRIAVLAIGYADGIPRSLSCGVGKVLIHGHEAPIIGRICMDQTLVDVSGILNVQAGDIAVVIGKSGNIEITACDIAKEAGTISNEILSRLGKRLERQMI